jgi:septal ring factor EnvC (AmiA/AmiB activator)
MQLRAEYRREAEISDRRAKIAKAIEVTERQVAVIDQKLGALQDMKAHLEQKLAAYDGWLQQLEEQAIEKAAARV